MRAPIATYRLQFNRHFRFSDATALVPYLYRLGISDVYASPLMAARRGSEHGYDVIDPLRLNPELGTDVEFEEFIRELSRHDMGLLLDIVPNHMAGSPENTWWADVLEDGEASPYAHFFDIDWRAAGGKLMLPILNAPFEHVVRDGGFTVAIDQLGVAVQYLETRLPLDLASYRGVLAPEASPDIGSSREVDPLVTELLDDLDALPPKSAHEATQIKGRRSSKIFIKQRLWELYSGNQAIRRAIDQNIAALNGTRAHELNVLERLIVGQVYELSLWRTGRNRVNYRRFFDVDHLVGVRVEASDVFDATHEFILRLAADGKLTGLRVDHIDGLYDPTMYLRRLQDQLPRHADAQTGEAKRFYVVVEKILAVDEELPAEWPVGGTTGYDFLNSVNSMFVDPAGLQALDRVYSEYTGSSISFPDLVYEEKKRTAVDMFAAEQSSLSRELQTLAREGKEAKPVVEEDAAAAISEVSACLPVYRTYVRAAPVLPRDRRLIEQAVSEARRRNSALEGAALTFLRRVLLLDDPSSAHGEPTAWLKFVMRWQQFTGPLMAKGLEDTALYVYNRLTSLNEVGGDPGTLPDAEQFHIRNQMISERRPDTMNATATHDTKRGEDARARINVLSELADEWSECLARWTRWNQDKKRVVGGRRAPDGNEELFLYQTLIAAWPLQESELPAFQGRLIAYVLKAAREAKVHTSWLNKNTAYEAALSAFATGVVEQGRGDEFLGDFKRFQEKVAYYGALNSLSQLVLKVTSPGIPDIYQGRELWDLSLVDPDNRRRIDNSIVVAALNELDQCEEKDRVSMLGELVANWKDGRIKLYITKRLLEARRAQARLFARGQYLPVALEGERSEHVVAFARRAGSDWAVAIVPRLVAGLGAPGELPVGRSIWGEDTLRLPQGAPNRWRNMLTGETVNSDIGSGLLLHQVLARLPVALLEAGGGN